MNMAVYTEQTTGNGYVNSDAPTDIRYGCALKETSMVGNAMVTMADMMLMFSQLANDKFTQMSKKMDVARDVQDMANRLEIIMSKLERDSDTADLPADIIKYMRENNILIGEETIDEFLARGGDAIDALNTWLTKYDFLNGNYESNKNGHMAVAGMDDVIKLFEKLGIKIKGQTIREFIETHKTLRPDGYMITNDDYRELMQTAREFRDSIDPNISKKQFESIKVALESAGGKASDFVQQSQLKLQQLMQNFNTAVTMANSVQSMNAESTKSIAQSIR